MKELLTVTAVSAPISFGNKSYINLLVNGKKYQIISDESSQENFDILALTQRGDMISITYEGDTLHIRNHTLNIGTDSGTKAVEQKKKKK